jgi:hypothetical protein
MPNVVTLIGNLTGEVRNYGSAPGGTFTFGLPLTPGSYTMINSSASSIVVSLYQQGFTVPSHTRWHFNVHENLDSIRVDFGAKPLGVQRAVAVGENVPTR